MAALTDHDSEDLVRDLAQRVAAVAPDWTDRQDDDPGITLVELFAFLGESLLDVTAISEPALVRLRGVVKQLEARMSTTDDEAIVERFWRLMEAREWQAARGLLDPEFVAEWPQSNERFPSPEAFMAMNAAHPAPNWHLASVTVQSTADEVVAEALLTNDEGADLAIGFYRVRDGLIRRAREYWIERRMEPTPAWRAEWTEAIAAAD